MKQAEIESSIGKIVVVNGFRDIGMDPDMRRIIDKDSKLIKRCKSGMLQIECEGKLYSLPPINVDLKAVGN
jgi:hypothetical protein